MNLGRGYEIYTLQGGRSPLTRTGVQVDADSSDESVKTVRQEDKEDLLQSAADCADHIGHAA